MRPLFPASTHRGKDAVPAWVPARSYPFCTLERRQSRRVGYTCTPGPPGPLPAMRFHSRLHSSPRAPVTTFSLQGLITAPIPRPLCSPSA